ncbi:hypothetical protein EKA98_01220 [Streptococcus pseudopneumoniae]|uniref:Uncharacterized protein n=1 Tax=Streptococcus pseudopneumoniae TaxID=257758 RepID=A0A3A4MM04_9STRE|nr:hypothetical protein [Streptococcus pseudopneumoniae]RJP07782.1 hypothetical protein C5O69_11430 [Streptococcus pseudopneumoniae]TMR77030.1 hypothetical protein E3V52_07855 [Streptococcus pseudopneumoniae]TMR87315.1 hypothetical protein E3V19_02525 [Streptococcus pseudopneumoniae]
MKRFSKSITIQEISITLYNFQSNKLHSFSQAGILVWINKKFRKFKNRKENKSYGKRYSCLTLLPLYFN